MIQPIAAKLTFITAVAFIPPAAVLFVLALGDTIHQGSALKGAASNTVYVFLLMLAIVGSLFSYTGAKGSPPKPTKLFWWGITLTIASSFFVLFAWLYTGRFNLPDPSNPRILSSLATTLIWTGIGLMLLGMCLIMFDIVRLAVKRTEAEVLGPLNADVESQRTRTFWPMNRFVPELDLFPTDEHAEKVLDESRSKARATRIFRILVLVLALGAVLFGIFSGRGLRPSQWVLFIAFPLGAVTFLFDREIICRHLRKELRSTGLQLCIQCGYDLRGQIEPRCPECGTPFEKSDEESQSGVPARQETDPNEE